MVLLRFSITKMIALVSENPKIKIYREIANKLLKSLNRIILKVELRKMLKATAWMKILIIFRATVDSPK